MGSQANAFLEELGRWLGTAGLETRSESLALFSNIPQAGKDSRMLTPPYATAIAATK